MMFTRTALLSLGQQCLNNALMNRVSAQVFDQIGAWILSNSQHIPQLRHLVAYSGLSCRCCIRQLIYWTTGFRLSAMIQ